MEKEPNRGPLTQRRSISYQSLFTGVLSFIGGAAALLIFIKVMGAGQVTFSVTGIISFIFGVALSSASIILAIAAISLGRASERTMVERSDESIRLQNEVFAKTTEALGRIQSSTGVTEKRIEDIIAGRAGAIAERLVEHRRVGPRSRGEIEKEIRESLLTEVHGSSNASHGSKSKEDEAKLREATVKHDRFRDAVLFHISDQSITKTRKIGTGYLDSSGDGLADGVFKTPSGRIAVCTFSIDPTDYGPPWDEDNFATFIGQIAKEFASETFQTAFFVVDRKLDADSPFMKALKNQREILSEKLFRRIVLIDGELEEVLAAMTKELTGSDGAASKEGAT